MEMKIKYPEYLNIKDWKYFKSLDNDTDTAKMVNFISYLANMPQEEIETYTPQVIQSTYLTILNQFKDIDSKFFPIIEIEDTLYGFSAISKMTLGEYMDLERLAKYPHENLEEIMAILYRPITKHSFKGIRWMYNKTFKLGIGEVENLFKYYTIEKYDSTKRTEQADIMATLPVSFALGALAFFLAVASNSLLSTQISLPKNKKEKKKLIQQITDLVSVNTGDGLLQFITYQKHPSLQSREIKVSQI